MYYSPGPVIPANHFEILQFSNNSILNRKFSEISIVKYLLSNTNLNIDTSKLALEERLLALFETNKISSKVFINFWKTSYPSKLTNKIWDKIDLNLIDFSNFFEASPNLIQVLIPSYPMIALRPEIWKLPMNIQDLVLDSLLNLDKEAIAPYFRVILDADSGIYYKILKIYGKFAVWYAMDYLNNSNSIEKANTELYKYIVLNEQVEVIEWVKLSNATLLQPSYYLLFNSYDKVVIEKLFSSVTDYIKAYKSIKEIQHFNTVYFSALFLGIGFRNALPDSHLLVVECFHEVYSNAASGLMKNNIWNFIPKDELEEDEDETPFFFQLLSTLLNIKPAKKKYQVDNWDYCEMLIRTLATKYNRNSWPANSFLSALKNPESFNRVISYLLSFKKGTRYLRFVLNETLKGNAAPLPFQRDAIEAIRIKLIPK